MDRGLLLTLVTSAVIAAFLTYFGYMRYESFSMSACGIGVYLQSLYNVCLGKPFYNTINGNLFFWKFEPILILLIPFFCLFKSPLVLIAAQALAISSTLPLVYALARELVRRPLLFTLIFAISPVFIGLALYDFSTISLSFPLLFATLLALERGKLKSFILFAFLFLTTSPVSALILLSIGFFISTRFEGEKRLWGNLLMLLGALWLLITFVVMQKLNPEWLWFEASHVDPYFSRRLMVASITLAYFLFTPFLTMEGFVSLVPLLTLSLLYKNAPYFFIGTYMPAPLYLLASVLSLYTISALERERTLAFSLPFSLLLSIIFNPFHPVVFKFDFVVYYGFPKVGEHQALLEKIVESLPNVPMLVQSNIFTHLYYRDNVYVDYKRGIKLAVMDSSSIWYPYVAASLLLKERFKNSCELFNIPLSQIIKLLSRPSPFVDEYEKEFKVSLAFDDIVVASRGVVKLNVSLPKGITGIFYKDLWFKEKALVMPFLKLYLDWKAWSPYITIPANNFSAVFLGKLKLEEGTYTFYLESDDGAWAKLGNKTIFNCLREGPCIDVYVLNTKGGIFPIKIKYREYSLNALIKVYYKKEGWKKIAYLNSTLSR